MLALSLLAGTLAAEPPSPPLSPEISRFVVANSEFTLLHEMGHMLIAELDLPVLGREEDAADQLAIMILFLFRDDLPEEEFDAKMLAIVDYWRLESQRPRRAEERVPAWASHALDEQRFYNITCLVYGSDTQRLDWLPRVAGLPMERALYCDQEYQQARKALDWIRHNNRRVAIQRRPRLQIVYDPPPDNRADEQLVTQIRQGGLEELARRVSQVFTPPRTLTLWVTACGSPDAWYNRDEAVLTLCYERLRHFRELAETLPPQRRPGPELECVATSEPPAGGMLKQPEC
ncbi:DUF4344 domain-containing metallopeptidase [Zestomonas carbonaria]|uniref:Metallopeptidase n=1 Tax=Zestomonas carbonaria TaxID=2762745 RepID=A0A7U7ETM6_9GAMM|nr:DUF4344 domain-containing metallopeptidase [Pseudomonas carbonaria]CAD5110330.1 hypothetical protein PSEWESI4_04650 [Pseudomonas carbonaria]